MPAAPPLLGSTGSTTFVLAALLVALGVAMILAAVWLVRATRADVRALGDHVRATVSDRFGVELRYEIEFVGAWPEPNE